jgi:hypothetical protein
MLTLTIIIVIYLIGCIFFYLRITGFFYEIEEAYIEHVKCWIPNYGNNFIHLISILSWFGFISGIIIYFINDEKYFFKKSFKKLNDYDKMK